MKTILFLILGFGFSVHAQSVAPSATNTGTPPPVENMAPPPTTPQPTPPPPQMTPPPMVQTAPAGFYYYCERLRAYYPTVEKCPGGWIAIPVGAPPPMYERHWMESVPLESEDAVRDRPNTVTAELLGRALFYSVDYDRALSEHITLGVGFSSWQTSDWWRNYEATVTVIPVYANYYFTSRPRRGYVSVGVDWVTVTSSGYNNDTFSNNGFAATVGGGYELRDSSGFITRLGGYLIIGRSTTLSPSVSLGYAF